MSRITPTIQKLHAQLLGKKISKQSFADTANSEITSIFQKPAFKILTHRDPSPHTRTIAKSHVKPPNHHSSKDPHEVLYQHNIQLHRDALATLRKDLSLDNADTPTYHQNKLKQAQNELPQSQTKKKQDKLLADVACDHGDDGVPAGKSWPYVELSPKIQKQSRKEFSTTWNSLQRIYWCPNLGKWTSYPQPPELALV